MREFFKKHGKYIVLFITLGVIIIPLIINSLFKIQAISQLFIAEWNAGDALTFYGCILGGFATITSIIITINNNRESLKEEKRLAVKPFLTLDFIDPQYCLENDITYDDKYFIEYKLNGYACVSKNMPIDFSGHKDSIFIFDVFNAGAGNAINVVLKINGYIVCKNVSILVNKKVRFIFDIKDDILQDKFYDMDLEIEYEDIISISHYKQSAKFMLSKHAWSEGLSCSQVNEIGISPPEKL